MRRSLLFGSSLIVSFKIERKKRYSLLVSVEEEKEPLAPCPRPGNHCTSPSEAEAEMDARAGAISTSPSERLPGVCCSARVVLLRGLTPPDADAELLLLFFCLRRSLLARLTKASSKSCAVTYPGRNLLAKW